ncbi:MAG: hypothetical protein H7323_11230, partial [Frankiales bacterium]|nr:hypothetical protein [Frankiales bacterium]
MRRSEHRAAEHWLHTGPLHRAVPAACAVRGLLAPVEIAASTVWVLQVGRIQTLLRPPRLLWEIAMVTSRSPPVMMRPTRGAPSVSSGNFVVLGASSAHPAPDVGTEITSAHPL